MTCDFETTKVQEEFDGIIVASKLSGLATSMTEYKNYCVLKIYHKDYVIDFCYVAFYFSSNKNFTSSNFYNLTNGEITCKNDRDFLKCLETLKNIIMEATIC